MLRISLSLLHDLFLLRLILCEYRHQVLWYRGHELEIFREFHEIVELNSLVLRDTVTTVVMKFHLLHVRKLAE